MFYQGSADYDAIAGPVDSAPRSSASDITRGFADHYTAVDINGLRQIFLMIPPGAGEVTVRDIAVSEYHYPFTGEAAFTSSDPELNRLYQAGIRTTEMNSFDAFTDCPTREQRAWVGDGVVQIILDEAHLLNITVKPENQGRGLGLTLLEHLMSIAYKADARECFLEVRDSNTAAFKLYERYGFNEIGRRRDYYPAVGGREDAVVMACTLVD